ncbi:response regulator transcription factor [Pedobacter sp. ASV28]|jgi:DNA-binding NarL/FixJ family response regulator|uniref:response regulator transcription factor n=1 Tax=Pedobacter sp. ASV28 TaxID=2795123 RepID=UPI0018ED5A57|nr:response regulator transcription factor [Pedobacter sp. ASV28]
MLKILIAESQLIVRERLKLLLAGQSTIKIVLETSIGQELLDQLLTGVALDLVLSGWHNGDKGELQWLRDAKKYRPALPVLLLTMKTNDENIRQAFLAGASGYLLSNICLDELLFAIRHVARGGVYLSSQLSLELINRLPGKLGDNVAVKPGLYTEEEIRLLQALADGDSNQVIAEKFFLSKRSIEGQRALLIKKAGVANTAALIRFACMNGLVV